MLKKILIACGLLVLSLLIGVGVLYWQTQTFLTTPAEEQGRDIVLNVVPGQSLDRVAAELEAQGLVSSAHKFRLMVRAKNQGTAIKAGEYLLNTSWPPPQILDMLTSGKVLLHKLSIPEGLTWWQVARLVEKSGLASFDSFDKAVHDPALLARYGITGSNAEGYLFPETYLLPRPRNKNARPIVEAMLKTFRQQARQALPADRMNPKELLRLVTLASMVEKETANPAERFAIAGVYSNRLHRSMLMQCDPTVIYGLGTSFDGNLTRKHLRDATNPYNTYKHKGLPPGPICSPGKAALEAALSPEKHKYYYFVATGENGRHKFSKTLVEHNRAVWKYQIRRRR